jgi:hypothetical protein
MVRNALKFVLAQDIYAVFPELKSIEEVEIAAKVGKKCKVLTKSMRKNASESNVAGVTAEIVDSGFLALKT